MVRKVLLSVVSAVAFCSLGFAQNRPVSGVVTNEEGSPLIGAIVTVQGTTTSSVTDASGRYTVTAPVNGSLEFASFGMVTRVIPVENRSIIDVTMSPDITNIDDVIVVAYGVVQRESFTGSASVVESSELSKRTVTDLSRALTGLVPGLVTTSGGGEPGAAASIQIRGQGSINASSSPLIVVDGAPYSGSLSSINTNDIASISVLKDASASALYGSRGANGVLMVTTRKGDGSGRVNVNFSANVGVSSRMSKPYATLNQDEFVEMTYAALRNQYLYTSGYTAENAHTAAVNDMFVNLGGQQYNPYKNKEWQTLIDPATGKIVSDAKSAWNENWIDEIKNKGALRQDYNVSVSGGNAKTTYAMSAGYMKTEGWLKYTDFERYTVTAGVDHKIKNWLKMGLSVSYAHTIQNRTDYSGTQTGNVWYTAQFMGPIYPIYLKDEAGEDLLDENGNRQLDYGDREGARRPKGDNFNALGDLRDNKDQNWRDAVRYNANITLGTDEASAGWLQGVKFALNFNGDNNNRMRLYYHNMYHGDAAPSNGDIMREHYRDQSYTFNQLLSWNRNFGKHSVEMLLGHEYYDFVHNNLWASRTDLFDGIYELAPGVNITDGNSYANTDRVEGFFVRPKYGFDNKYYIDASYRRDGSSRFNQDYRWGDFWSVGASWRVSQENFMKSVTWVDYLTFRMSYGSVGNNNLSSGYYAWQSFYDLSKPNASQAGAIISSLANPPVSWETIGTFNVGVDASLFSNRLRITADYYIKKTSDMLLEYPMATSTGFNGYNANAGDMTNSGIEITIGGTIINKPNFVWDATLMGYHNKNKVNKLTESNQIVNGVRVIEVGKPLNTYWMSKSAGVDPATGQQLYWVYDTKKEEDGTETIVNERISSDKAKAATSRYYLGKRSPDFQGSISSNFSIFKNFDLSFLATFGLGGKIYESNYAASMQPTYIGDNFNKHILRAWSKPGDVTDVPRAEFNQVTTTNDRWLINASYLAINNITFGYSLPTRIAQKVDMNSLRLYLTLDNLAIFNHLDGMDNNYNFSGGVDYSYAPVRTISLGLNFNF